MALNKGGAGYELRSLPVGSSTDASVQLLPAEKGWGRLWKSSRGPRLRWNDSCPQASCDSNCRSKSPGPVTVTPLIHGLEPWRLWGWNVLPQSPQLGNLTSHVVCQWRLEVELCRGD